VPYKAWCQAIIAEYGSITSYICQKRLGWEPLSCVADATGPVFAVQGSTPFADSNDYRIERNDWPYGILGAEITRLVVWLKVRMWTEPETGLMTGELKALAEGFVKKVFVERLRKEGPGAEARILWFKNWTALQSVRGLEYIYVLVRDFSDDVVDQWTGKERPHER